MKGQCLDMSMSLREGLSYCHSPRGNTDWKGLMHKCSMLLSWVVLRRVNKVQQFPCNKENLGRGSGITPSPLPPKKSTGSTFYRTVINIFCNLSMLTEKWDSISEVTARQQPMTSYSAINIRHIEKYVSILPSPLLSLSYLTEIYLLNARNYIQLITQVTIVIVGHTDFYTLR